MFSIVILVILAYKKTNAETKTVSDKIEILQKLETLLTEKNKRCTILKQKLRGMIMDMIKWFNQAKETIQKLPYGKSFELRQLFQEVKWNTLAKGERITFGKYFKNQIIEGKLPEVCFLDKAKNNHAKYKKLKKENEIT